VGSVRLYKKRFLRRGVERKIASKRETRDAIVWDVLSGDDDRKCRVKIQGSNQLITAHYPFNWGTNPEWVKPANSVRIAHEGGIRGRIEVVGHGQLVPSPVSGSAAPTVATAPDAVLSGSSVHQMPDPTDMKVMVKLGSYRINGSVYTLSSTTMETASVITMGEDKIIMGEIAAVIELDAAPAIGYYRYDLISIGTDGVVDYTAGVAVTSDPAVPALAANHIQLATILVYGTMTVVTNADINAIWQATYLSYATGSVSDEDLDWMSESTSVITLTAYDQYGVQYSRPIGSGGLLFSLEFAIGNGTLSNAVSATRSEIFTSDASVNFTYTRDNEVGDISPYFNGAVEESYALPVIDLLNINLYDSDGDLMT
jgi:hypothetical protein